MTYEQNKNRVDAFRAEILANFKKVFHGSEIKSQGKESWIEFTFNGKVYAIRFIDSHLYQALEFNIPSNQVSLLMLRESFEHIVKDSLK